MATIFCPTCNRSSETTRFVGEFCEVCTIGKLTKQLKDKAEITICSACGKVKTREGYVKLDRTTLAVAIKTAMHLPEYLLQVENTTDNPANVEFITDVEGKPVSFSKQITLKISGQRCKECYQRSSGYYEAIFKVHGDEEKVQHLSERFKRFIEHHDGFISKVDETGNGLEIYASNKKAANEFFVRNQIKVNRSYNLYGSKHGKKLYRNIYSLRV